MFKSKQNGLNAIPFEDIVYFFYSSWISGFKILGINLQKELNEIKFITGMDSPSISQLVTWAKRYQDNIKIYLESSFKESGINYSQDISYEAYKQWTSRNPQNIQIFYANKFLTIATNLNTLIDVELVK